MLTLFEARIDPGPGVAYRGGLNFDGLLLYALTGEAETDSLKAMDKLPPAPDLPLARYPYGTMDGERRHVYASSDMQFDTSAAVRSTANWVRRFTEDGRERPYKRMSGEWGGQWKTAPLVVAERVYWLAWFSSEAGIAEAVAALSDNVRALGALRGHGYGRVREWRVEILKGKPRDAIVDCGGTTIRALPEGFFPLPGLYERLPLRPPYWHQSSLDFGLPAGASDADEWLTLPDPERVG